MDLGAPAPEAGRARVLILGTGAMAKLFGARLARTGRAAVLLAGAWRAAVDAIAARGITVEEADGGGRWTVVDGVRAVGLDAVSGEGPHPPAPSSSAAGEGVRRRGGGDGALMAGFDLVVVLVKAHRTAAVAPVAARAVSAGGLVVTLQNGLGQREALAAGG
ncbi:MAG: hypothetical protein DYG90_13985, partial [Chloroflexi bacterium CFX6]|nr:hypothetical protein [Chloroflexi bacterium CFX6]